MGYSSVSTRQPSFRGPASDSLSASGLSSGAGAASGFNQNQAKGARSFSLFRTSGSTRETGESAAPACILLVEDNPADVLLVREALEEHQVRADVYVVSDGEKAVRFVEEDVNDLPCPDLIILDLNLPRKTGREVLEHILMARSNREIARQLGIEERTVKAHVGRLMRKTGSDNRIELSMRALHLPPVPHGKAGQGGKGKPPSQKFTQE